MTGFTIRQLLADDWQIFSSLRLQSLQECPGFFGSRYEDESKFNEKDWRRWLSYPDTAMFGLFEIKELVGVTGVRNDSTADGTGFMIASYIIPAYRGKGLSDMLYRARIAWAKNYISWKKLTISHREDNIVSGRANQRHGFVFTQRKPKLWPDGKYIDELIYELDLEQLRLKK